LLNTIRPDFAVFGQKDAQQVAVVKRLTRDLGFETEIVSVPTVREPSGLALSSRNSLLTEDERERAAVIYKALSAAKEAASAGQRNASKLAEMVTKTVSAEPLANIDYIAVVDADALEPIEKIGDREAMIAIAVRFGEIRLIDNVKIGKRQ
jgi:pantoate--beta-alanine ligase